MPGREPAPFWVTHPETDVVKNTIQYVNVSFLTKSGSLDIKLIEPASEDSHLLQLLRTKGGGITPPWVYV